MGSIGISNTAPADAPCRPGTPWRLRGPDVPCDKKVGIRAFEGNDLNLRIGLDLVHEVVTQPFELRETSGFAGDVPHVE
jgi:hypothetical protein